jgi:hypothetical protein
MCKTVFYVVRSHTVTNVTTFFGKTRQKNGFPFLISLYSINIHTSLSLLSYAQLGKTCKQTVKSLNDKQCDGECLYSQGEILCFFVVVNCKKISFFTGIARECN